MQLGIELELFRSNQPLKIILIDISLEEQKEIKFY